MTDIEIARRLRSSGKTYSEIARILKCSLGWCKKNLKGFNTEKQELTCDELAEITRKVNCTEAPLVCGVGRYTKGEYRAKIGQEFTKEYLVWRAMLSRCYTPSKRTSYTYEDCYVCEEFKDFQYFATWCNRQIGFNTVGYQLDKDILFQGNKIYSPDTCVFIPKDLNCFNRVNEGMYLQGVCWHDKTGKYRARVQDINTHERVHLGLYADEISAFLAYAEAKNKQAKAWLQKLLSGEFKVDQRVIDRMKIWECPVPSGLHV